MVILKGNMSVFKYLKDYMDNSENNFLVIDLTGKLLHKKLKKYKAIQKVDYSNGCVYMSGTIDLLKDYVHDIRCGIKDKELEFDELIVFTDDSETNASLYKKALKELNNVTKIRFLQDSCKGKVKIYEEKF